MKTHYHFVGIGGMGMGTIASLLMDKGMTVSGSDIKEGFFTRFLAGRGATVCIGHKGRNVGSADCVVCSSAIPPDNPELVAAGEKGIPVKKRAEVLAGLLNRETGVTVAGAHGKTTTSSMIARVLIAGGLDPTALVGGIVKDDTYHARMGAGKYFIAELDESDGSFLLFEPTYAVITNIDYEHVDYFRNWDNILSAYGRFMKNTKAHGRLIVCGEDARLVELAKGVRREVFTYGFSRQCHLSAGDVLLEGFGSRFRCFLEGKPCGEIVLQMPGRHNVLNALAAVGVGLALEIDFDLIKESLRTYMGVERRFQQKGEVGGIMIVDDYAHHPNEIRETLKAAQSLGHGRVVAVFQPHRYSRTKFLFDMFPGCFEGIDYLIVTDIYAANEEPIGGLSVEALCKAIKARNGFPVEYVKKEGIVDRLMKVIRQGDLVLTLGAGDIVQVGEELQAKLKDSLVKKSPSGEGQR